MTELEKRAAVLKLTKAKFGAQAFKWGGADCGRMVAFHLRKFGHKPPQSGGYRSALGAKKRLKQLGFENLPDLIDSLGLVEIPWSFCRIGDIVSFPSDDAIGGVGIVWGNGNMMCFHESHMTPVIMTMHTIDKAWSVV
jgi:hypothetical protein